MPFTKVETHRLGGRASHARRNAAERSEYARALAAKRWDKNKAARVDGQSARAEDTGYRDVLSVASISVKGKEKDDGTETTESTAIDRNTLPGYRIAGQSISRADQL